MRWCGSTSRRGRSSRRRLSRRRRCRTWPGSSPTTGFEAEQHREWRLAAPADSYQYGDALPGERPDAGWTTLFPHLHRRARGLDAVFADHWQKSPLSDAYLGRLAALIDRVAARAAGTTDLGVSFSALDMVGHDFGPRSREVEDILIHLDATLGALIDHLDRAVGRDRYLLALTADHGVAVIPEQHGAGRIANEDLGAVVEQALVQTWGAPSRHLRRRQPRRSDLFRRRGVRPLEACRRAAVRAVELALREVPGLARVVRRDQIDRGDAITRAIARGYVADRSGDLFMVPQRDWIIEQRVDGDATTHGTMYNYDSRVPLLLLGWRARPLHEGRPARHRPDAGARGGRPILGPRRAAARMGGAARRRGPAATARRLETPATYGVS